LATFNVSDLTQDIVDNGCFTVSISGDNVTWYQIPFYASPSSITYYYSYKVGIINLEIIKSVGITPEQAPKYIKVTIIQGN